MINVIKSEERHHQNFGWLDTRWHFSFGDYHDPNNESWGPLRVFNDDVVEGGGGFPLHPHRDMEIISYVLKGGLQHQDHLGGNGVIKPGEVQVMSAGKGIMHAEFNASKTEPAHFLQLWIVPRSKGNKPRWEQKEFTAADRAGKLLPIASGHDENGAPYIDQDATVYVSSLKQGETLTHTASPGRKAYLFMIEGSVTVNRIDLARGDQARIADEAKLEIAATQEAELMLLDLPA